MHDPQASADVSLQLNHHDSIQPAQQKRHKAGMQATRPGVTYLCFLKLSLQPLQIFLQSVGLSLMLSTMSIDLPCMQVLQDVCSMTHLWPQIVEWARYCIGQQVAEPTSQGMTWQHESACLNCYLVLHLQHCCLSLL